jgi:hypothetical protein
MTLLEAIDAVTAGDAQRIAEPGAWKVYRSGGKVIFERVEDGWTPRVAALAAEA